MPIPLIAGGLAAAGAGALSVAGNALFDIALNPQAKNSALRYLGADLSGSSDVPPSDGTPRGNARAWFAEARQSIALPAPDGGELLGWYVLAPGASLAPGRALGAEGNPSAPSAGFPDAHIEGGAHRYAVLCHGYAGSPADMALEAQLACGQGVSVLVPAARGHERNVGRYVGMGWLDARDLLGWAGLIALLDPQARIALFGVSMGGAEVMMASGLELPPHVRCIVEDCGFTSVWDEFSLQLRQLIHVPPTPFLAAADAVCRARAGYGFKEASAVRQLARARVPMLFVHGSEDLFVPFWMLDKVFDACASPVKERLVIEGAHHANSADTDPDRYWGTVGAFLARHL